MAQTDLGRRVQGLIDRYHDGSVNAAAETAGIPQPTLRRIVAGLVEHPRKKAVRQLAKTYMVSEEWLLHGTGPGPNDTGQLGKFLSGIRWIHLVQSLKLDDETLDGYVLMLPMGPLLLDGVLRSGSKPEDPWAPQSDAIVGDLDASCRAWCDILSTRISIYGMEKVREQLKQWGRFALQPPAMLEKMFAAFMTGTGLAKPVEAPPANPPPRLRRIGEPADWLARPEEK